MEEAPVQKVLKNPPLRFMRSRMYCMLISRLSCSLVLSRSRGMPVVTRDQPARLPAVNSIARSSITQLLQSFDVNVIFDKRLVVTQRESKKYLRHTHQYKIMKQNQHQNRFVPNQKPELKHHDFLTLKAHCTCAQCQNITQTISPEITLDQELIQLRANARRHTEECDFIFFLNHLRRGGRTLPKMNFLDTVVMKGGEGYYSMHFEEGKLKITDRVNTKAWIIERKQFRDLQYQIKKHEREHHFNFTAFEHKCEKKIKEFENNIKYKIPTVLNRTAIIKLRRQEQQLILSKNEFENLFDTTKHRTHQPQDIEYVQVFPVMSGEEESSYVKTVKYFRQKEHQRKSFKLAEMYVSTWLQRNDSLQKLEEGVYQEIREANNAKEITEEDKLLYQSFKLLLYFQEVSNIRIEQAVLHFFTNDNGKTFFLKSLQCLKTDKRASVQEIGIELPTKRDIQPQDYINLRSSMQKLFDGFQRQYERLDKEREEMEMKLKKDKEYSNMVFRTVADRKNADLHEILAKKNLKFKKTQLNL